MDITQLSCPSNIHIKKVDILGVVAFYHPDGSSCGYINNFDMQVESILQEIIRSGVVDTPKVRAAIVVSENVRKFIYQLLSVSRGKDLAELLNKVVVIFSKTSISDTLLSELVNTFGEVVVENIKMCSGYDIARFYSRKVKKKMKMSKLDTSDVQLIGKQKIVSKQTLDNIIDLSLYNE